MIDIMRVTPDMEVYELTLQFVRRLYLNDLKADVAHRPAYFFVAVREGEVVGCLGLDNGVSSPLFTNDLRFQRLEQTWGMGVHAVTQSYFAVVRHSIAVPTLIAAAAAYGEAVGINKIAYAGIATSCRTIERLGLQVTTLGPTNLQLLTPAMQEVMAFWHRQYNPVTCVLDTGGAREIALGVLDRHKCRVCLTSTLDQEIFGRVRQFA